ncbi:MAG: DUF1844 domain-containing protein [Candidatus Binatia bacterium]
MADERGEGKGFKVEDRRRFSPDTGESRSDTDTDPSAQPTRTPVTEGPEKTPDSPDEPLPEINFSTFVISLSTQALMHLGEIPNPLSGQVERDIPVAKQMIDIIAMLREKSRGNLDQGEDKLIDEVLFDLRMRYVDTVKKK